MRRPQSRSGWRVNHNNMSGSALIQACEAAGATIPRYVPTSTSVLLFTSLMRHTPDSATMIGAQPRILAI